METIEKRLERLEYYQKIMLELIDLEKRPFHHLLMKQKLAEDEVAELYRLCEELTMEYKKQKAEGFVGFSPLLKIFSERLNPKLSLLETIEALHKERIYMPLMTVLKNTIIDQHTKSS
ncbi:DUF1878 family protein [Bacillus sp. AK128]